MTAAATILAQLTASGCHVELLPDGERISLDPTPTPHLLALARQHRDDLAALLRDTARAHVPPAAPQARQGVLPVDPPPAVVSPGAAPARAATRPDVVAMQKPETRAEAPTPSLAISPELERNWLAEQGAEAQRERDHEAREAAAWANASQPANTDADTLCCDAIAARSEAIEQERIRPELPDPEAPMPPPEGWATGFATTAPPQADPAAIERRAAELLEGARAHPAITITDAAKAADYFRGRALAEARARARALAPGNQPASIGRLRPVSWSDVSDTPRPGDRCDCCGSSRWWTESALPRGWRCGACHPPAVPFGVRWVRS